MGGKAKIYKYVSISLSDVKLAFNVLYLSAFEKGYFDDDEAMVFSCDGVF